MRSVFRDFQKCNKAAYRAAKPPQKTRNRVFFLKSLFRDFREILKMIFDRIIHKQTFVAKRGLNGRNGYDIINAAEVLLAPQPQTNQPQWLGADLFHSYCTRIFLACQSP